MRRAMPAGDAYGWLALAISTLGTIAVFSSFDAIPFMDLPAHAGLIALRARLATSPFEQQFYVLAPHFGAYSLFRGLGDLLSRAVGPVGAVRTLATLSVIALPASILETRRRLYGQVSPAFGCAGIVLGFGLMTLFGFATYMLGVAVLVASMALWLDLLTGAGGSGDDRGAWKRGLSMACCAAVLFVTHGFAFVVFLACAAVSWLTTMVDGREPPPRRSPTSGRRGLAMLATLLPALALAACATWAERSSSAPPGSAPPPRPGTGMLFQPLLDKLSLLATPTLMTRTGLDLAIGGAVWVITIASVIATVVWLRRVPQPDPGARRARTCARALLACQFLLLLAFAVLPHEIGWFGFVDGRLLIVLLVFAMLGVPPAAIGTRLAIAYERAMPLLSGAIVTLALVASYLFQIEARGYDDVLSSVPSNTRLLNLPIDPNSDVFTGHPFVHYDKLVLADRPVLVSDLWFHQGSGVYPRPGNPVLRLPPDYLSSKLRSIDWARIDLADWDYVLLRTRPSAAAPSTPASLSLAKHVGGWWLYSTGALTNGRR